MGSCSRKNKASLPVPEDIPGSFQSIQERKIQHHTTAHPESIKPCYSKVVSLPSLPPRAPLREDLVTEKDAILQLASAGGGEDLIIDLRYSCQLKVNERFLLPSDQII